MPPVTVRRSFLASAAAALASRHLPLSALGTPAGKLNRIGIELYAVRGSPAVVPQHGQHGAPARREVERLIRVAVAVHGGKRQRRPHGVVP